MHLLTAPEAARILRVRPARIYQLAREHRIPACRVGRQLRISEAALRRWINQGGQALPGGWRREAPADAPSSIHNA